MGFDALLSYTPLAVCQLLYAYNVAGAWRYPENYTPRRLSRAVIVSHNVFLVAWSSFMMITSAREFVSKGYSLYGNSYHPDHSVVSYMVRLFYASKIYEFIDTYLMLYRGSLRQVSFLHVYHHLTMSSIWWLIDRIAPGGDSIVPVIINSGIHVVMYTYYALSVILPRRYMWWGRYLTQCQMLQFVVITYASTMALFSSSNYPKGIHALSVIYNTSLLAMFRSFYNKKHSTEQIRHD